MLTDCKLYLVDDDAHYWVAAHDAEHATQVVLTSEAVSPEDFDWDKNPPRVVEISERRARELTVDDGCGEEITLWDAFCEERTRPHVVACSEY